jgi:transposase
LAPGPAESCCQAQRGRLATRASARIGPLPALHAFVRGLCKDLEASLAGLRMPYNNGSSESANTKVKVLKRQMYGRAGFALLRQRILRR